jgi:hypothetical protein
MFPAQVARAYINGHRGKRRPPHHHGRPSSNQSLDLGRDLWHRPRALSAKPASSEGWLDELGDGPDGGGEDLRGSTIVEQTALLESFNSARHRALQATDTDVEGNTIEPSYHTAALEERGPHNPPVSSQTQSWALISPSSVPGRRRRNPASPS